ncbi:hypothetical protein B0H14DRAFT_2592343 [Mycena olivaceomarginata]|nr:hypothetical protein B0H14DRAFT_2592343 [Mycena olivaceomarginata]
MPLNTHQPGYAQRRDRESAAPARRVPEVAQTPGVSIPGAYRAGDVLEHNVASVVVQGETIKDGKYDDTDAPKACDPSTKNTRVSLEVERDHVRDCCGVGNEVDGQMRAW